MATVDEQIKAGLATVQAIAEAVREAGEIPSGHLYAVLMGRMDLPTYQRIIGILVNAQLVRQRGDVLVWIA